MFDIQKLLLARKQFSQSANFLVTLRFIVPACIKMEKAQRLLWLRCQEQCMSLAQESRIESTLPMSAFTHLRDLSSAVPWLALESQTTLIFLAKALFPNTVICDNNQTSLMENIHSNKRICPALRDVSKLQLLKLDFPGDSAMTSSLSWWQGQQLWGKQRKMFLLHTMDTMLNPWKTRIQFAVNADKNGQGKQQADIQWNQGINGCYLL